MEIDTHAKRLAALSHPGRLSVFRLIVRHAPGTVRPGDMLDVLDLKPNTLSVYLGSLSDAGLVTAERHGTAIHYRADLTAIGSLVDFLVADCCRGRPDICAPRTAASLGFETSDSTARSPYRVLFICTGNSARSVIAETLLREEGENRFEVHSAGTRASSALNPFAIEILKRNGHDISGLHPKALSEVQGECLPTFDFVFTVCDLAASEECASWPGQPVTGHWSIPDPAQTKGSEAEISLAFADTYAQLRRRITAFAALPLETLDRLSVQKHLDDISSMETD